MTLTDEEYGKGDEEQEDVWHQREGVQEAAVVEDAGVHVVRGRVVFVAAERQGHAGVWSLRGSDRRKTKTGEKQKETLSEHNLSPEQKKTDSGR